MTKGKPILKQTLGRQDWHDNTILNRDFKEINKTRRLNEMSPIVSKTRKCLRCEKEFLSIGFANRMCHSCSRYGE